jgi:hypothetical protein
MLPPGPPLAKFSKSPPVKLEPRRNRPITLFISFVALDVGVRKLSDLPTKGPSSPVDSFLLAKLLARERIFSPFFFFTGSGWKK